MLSCYLRGKEALDLQHDPGLFFCLQAKHLFACLHAQHLMLRELVRACNHKIQSSTEHLDGQIWVAPLLTELAEECLKI